MCLDLMEQSAVLVAPSFGAGVDRTRPTLKIQDGCNNRCAYCVIPFVRGKSRSLPPDEVIGHLQRLVGEGYQEVVLSGVDMGSYGFDFKPRTDLLELIQRALQETSVPLLRLSSLEPMDLTEEFLALLASTTRIARHIHAPLQSGSNRILRRMRRWYTAEAFAERIERARAVLGNVGIGITNPDGTFTESGQHLLDEAYRVMQACGNPNAQTNAETGIVIGYVQSGKTLSFTTLAALARDSEYQLVIVIAGTSVNLVNQSTDRLRRDLRLNTRFDRKWTLLQNPSRIEDRETIETTLAQWADPTYQNDRCRTVLITVMKNGSHLRNLTNLLTGLSLEGVPTLIIDDEGDQASLNTRARRQAPILDALRTQKDSRRSRGRR